jgi:signal transduction histidine kinase
MHRDYAELLAANSFYAGVLHDLSAEFTALDLALRLNSSPSTSAYKKHLEQMRKLLRTPSSLANHGSSFSTFSEISRAVELLRFKYRLAAVDLKITETKIELRGSPVQFSRLLLNLLSNALLACQRSTREFKRVEIIESLQARNYSLIIRDNGCGMSPADLALLSEPRRELYRFKGRGIGLAIVRELAEQAFGGKLMINSRLKEGTSVQVLIPLSS